jgi:hypothetical protein
MRTILAGIMLISCAISTTANAQETARYFLDLPGQPEQVVDPRTLGPGFVCQPNQTMFGGLQYHCAPAARLQDQQQAQYGQQYRPQQYRRVYQNGYNRGYQQQPPVVFVLQLGGGEQHRRGW